MATGEKELVAGAVRRLQEEVPALANLKLVGALELTAGGLTGPSKSQRYRVEVPGPKVSQGDADDARIALSIPKAMFDLLAKEGSLADWRDALYYGHLKATGDQRVLRLLGKAIAASS